MAAKLARLVYRMLRYGMNTWTEERPFTRLNTSADRSSTSSGKPPSWDSASLKLRQLKAEFLESTKSRRTFFWACFTEGIKVRRQQLLIWAAWLVYVAAWFFPVVKEGVTLPDGLPGWQAFRVAASAVLPLPDVTIDKWYKECFSP